MPDIRVSDVYRFVDKVCELMDREDLSRDKREALAGEIIGDLEKVPVYIEPS